jgi:uncharacterized protein (DUF849 family)
MNGEFARILTAAHEEMEQVRTCLLHPTPDSLGRCEAALSRAAAGMQHLHAHLHDQTRSPQLIPQLERFRCEIRRNQVLLASAGHLYFGARQSVTVSAGLYDRNAGPAGMAPSHRLSMLG